MKKLFLKLLKFCIGKFQNEILSHIHNTSAVVTTQLIFDRASLITDALLDSNPNNEEQIKEILKQTLTSEAFITLEKEATAQLVLMIKDENLSKILIGTEGLRLEIFKVLADDNTDNVAQIKDIVGAYTESEEFIEYVSLLAQYLITKKIKNGRNSK
jgi:hypothetical protein